MVDVIVGQTGRAEIEIVVDLHEVIVVDRADLGLAQRYARVLEDHLAGDESRRREHALALAGRRRNERLHAVAVAADDDRRTVRRARRRHAAGAALVVAVAAAVTARAATRGRVVVDDDGCDGRQDERRLLKLHIERRLRRLLRTVNQSISHSGYVFFKSVSLL